MSHDRIEGDIIRITHDYIAVMLAVRRPGVTTSLHVPEGLHLIKSKRGAITVRVRSGLEEYAANLTGGPNRNTSGPLPETRRNPYPRKDDFYTQATGCSARKGLVSRVRLRLARPSAKLLHEFSDIIRLAIEGAPGRQIAYIGGVSCPRRRRSRGLARARE